MTPEAVIDRYLETASREPFDPTEFALLLGTDADLLSRWLQLLCCPADPTMFIDAVAAMPAAQLQDLALSQALSVLTVSGSARLSFERWQAALQRSVVAEVLALELALADPVAVRWRVLLACSGVKLPHDPGLAELLAFRGVRVDLLEDASAMHRVLAVVEALDDTDPLRGQETAHALLGVGAERFHELLAIADSRCRELITSLGLGCGGEARCAEQVWLRLQVVLLGRLLPAGGAAAPAELREAHELICRRLFGVVPVLFLLSGDGQRLLPSCGEAPELTVASRTSMIARSVREGERFELIDRPDQSVADRQVLRDLHSASATCRPLIDGLGVVHGVLVFAADEEGAQERARALYAVELARRLARPSAGAVPDGEVLARFRQREEKRLRELVHEANNPLSIVNNYLHMLELQLEHEPAAVEQLRMIGAELGRCGDIIAQLRDLPGADSECVEPRVEYATVELNALTRRVVELHLGYAREYQVTLTEQLTAGTLAVRSDEQRLVQILSNLLRNAIEAAPGASVTASTQSGVYREGRPGVLLEVADTGPGLPESVLERLAEPKETSKGGEHSGLGLHLVHRLVGELGGSIDVRTAAGQGTAFTLFLPVDPAAGGHV